MSATKAQSYLYIPASTYRFDRVSVQHESSHLPVFTQCQASLTLTLLLSYTPSTYTRCTAEDETRWFVSRPVAQQHRRKKDLQLHRKKRDEQERPAVPCTYCLASLSGYFLVVALRGWYPRSAFFSSSSLRQPQQATVQRL